MLLLRSTALLFLDQQGYLLEMLKPDNASLISKLKWCLSLPGVTPVLLRELTKTSSSSVSEWKRSGRIAKAHLIVLAQISKTRPEYWLDRSAPIPPTSEWFVPNTTQPKAANLQDAIEIIDRHLRTADPRNLAVAGSLFEKWVSDPKRHSGNKIPILSLIGGAVPDEKLEHLRAPDHIHSKTGASHKAKVKKGVP